MGRKGSIRGHERLDASLFHGWGVIPEESSEAKNGEAPRDFVIPLPEARVWGGGCFFAGCFFGEWRGCEGGDEVAVGADGVFFGEGGGEVAEARVADGGGGFGDIRAAAAEELGGFLEAEVAEVAGDGFSGFAREDAAEVERAHAGGFGELGEGGRVFEVFGEEAFDLVDAAGGDAVFEFFVERCVLGPGHGVGEDFDEFRFAPGLSHGAGRGIFNEVACGVADVFVEFAELECGAGLGDAPLGEPGGLGAEAEEAVVARGGAADGHGGDAGAECDAADGDFGDFSAVEEFGASLEIHEKQEAAAGFGFGRGAAGSPHPQGFPVLGME